MSDLIGFLFRLLARWSGIDPAPRHRPTPKKPIPNPPKPSNDPRSRVVDRINSARAESGLAPLDFDPRLSETSAAWAQSMASSGTLDHGDFAGRIASVYPNVAAAEDIAEGQPDADSVVDAWLADPPHLDNILGPYNRLGVGSAPDAGGSIYWCVDFVQVA